MGGFTSGLWFLWLSCFLFLKGLRLVVAKHLQNWWPFGCVIGLGLRAGRYIFERFSSMCRGGGAMDGSILFSRVLWSCWGAEFVLGLFSRLRCRWTSLGTVLVGIGSFFFRFGGLWYRRVLDGTESISITSGTSRRISVFCCLTGLGFLRGGYAPIFSLFSKFLRCGCTFLGGTVSGFIKFIVWWWRKAGALCVSHGIGSVYVRFIEFRCCAYDFVS